MHRITHRFLAAALGLLLLSPAACERRQHLVEQHLLEFGTIIKITLITDDLNHAESLLGEIETRLQRYRRQWHAWEDSDLTRFNAALKRYGRAAVPESLERLIALSLEYHEASGGLFDPALGRLIGAYGFHDGAPDEAAIAALGERLPTMRDLQVEDGFATSRHPHLQLDLGGIAKGYAIGLIAGLLDANGIENYIVNAGGDMQIAGNRFGHPWRLGIENPFAPGIVASLELDGRYSLFTSGNYRRQYRHGGGRRHHIIDPRSGESSRGQSSATVLAEDPVRADVAATVLMIAASSKSRELALSLGVQDFLVITETRQMLTSRSFAEKLEIRAEWPIKIVN